MQVLYVYAVTRPGVLPDAEAVDGSRRFESVADGEVAAVFTRVAAGEFSQESIDRRAGDLEWLGAIGYRHQGVMADLMRRGAVVPLRAFTLFSSAEALLEHLRERHADLVRLLDRLGGRREWTLRIEFEAAKWSEALVGRVASLAALQREIESAPPGKAFLLKKKLADERKGASREAEQHLLAEVEKIVVDTLACETIAETRQSREGAFPQIDVLLEEGEEARLEDLRSALDARYAAEGVTLAVTGPWPPYTFAALQDPAAHPDGTRLA